MIKMYAKVRKIIVISVKIVIYFIFAMIVIPMIIIYSILVFAIMQDVMQSL